jgi:hypothetical protein
MVMVFSFLFDQYYYQDCYLALPNRGTHPGACVRCDSGGLLFWPQGLVWQGAV